MSKKRFIVLLASIGLILVLVLSGCTAPEAEPEIIEKTVTETVEKVVEVEKEYRCLNPEANFIPVETSALSPRLDTMDGKTVYIIQGEADPVIMPALAERLPHDYPNTTFVYYNPTSSFGSSSPDDTVVAEADAVVRGIGW